LKNNAILAYLITNVQVTSSRKTRRLSSATKKYLISDHVFYGSHFI